MRISDSCQNTVVSTTQKQRGMTLLELVVVLFIAALVTGVALPYTLNMIRANHDQAAAAAILDTLNSLSLRAYSEGRSVTLSTKTVRVLLPGIPQNWRIEVPKPIVFNLNGLCESGVVVLHTEKGDNTILQIKPPSCHFTPQ